MNIYLNKDQIAFKESLTKFAKKELNEDIRQDDKSGKFNFENWEKCATMGVLSLYVSKEYGGMDADPLSLLTIFHALGKYCKDNGLVHALVTQTCCIILLSKYGTKDQKKNNLSYLVSGKKIAAQAITEPDAGSDVLAMKTRAKLEGEKYILDGRKTFISNGPIAELIFVFAVTDRKRVNFGGVSCFIVNAETNGLNRGKPIEKLGLTTLQNGDIIFEDCSVARECLIGREGQGMMIFNEILEWERALMAAIHLGQMERILEECINYAKTREQFGKAIGKFQAISNKIADIKVSVELGNAFLYKIALLKKEKKRAAIDTSIIKLFVSENLKRACLEAIQIYGGYGYAKEFEMERELRDSLAATIYSGTSEIQRNIISSLIGL
jgi:hypothetical protein